LEHTDERKKELDKAQKKKEERDPLSLSFCLSLSLYNSLSHARLSLSLLRVARCTEFWDGGKSFSPSLGFHFRFLGDLSLLVLRVIFVYVLIPRERERDELPSGELSESGAFCSLSFFMYSVLFRRDLLLWKSLYSSCSSSCSSSFAIELDWVPLLRVVWGMVVLLSLSLSFFYTSR
jgi:hypothetical protein